MGFQVCVEVHSWQGGLAGSQDSGQGQSYQGKLMGSQVGGVGNVGGENVRRVRSKV